ncbi:MAG: endonuclease III [Desulfuromonas sp.]|nr:endonuclease III [Desulfuromonas sp.]
MSQKKQRENIAQILRVLNTHYPDARCSLNYTTPLELLMATILSAQTTDVRVNKVTRQLFEQFPDVHAYARSEIEDVVEVIRTVGCYRNKARNLVLCAQRLCAHYDGKVPQTMEQLVTLPGVGRKTANVVLSNGFGVPGLPVDTHVKRVSKRLGWTTHTEPEKIEQQLCRLIEPQQWGHSSHLLIYHGRATCKARKVECERCPVESLCEKQL